VSNFRNDFTFLQKGVKQQIHDTDNLTSI